MTKPKLTKLQECTAHRAQAESGAGNSLCTTGTKTAQHTGSARIANMFGREVVDDEKGLGTDEEILELSKDAWGRDKLYFGRDDHTGFYVAFARLIEAKLKKKN